MSSRPLHGESIYLHDKKIITRKMRILVLVPSTGNLYIYMEEAIDDCEEVSSRPLHGESIYLLTMFNTMRAVKQCSRPLHGESIYLQKLLGDDMKDMIVLVPSTGNLYIY